MQFCCPVCHTNVIVDDENCPDSISCSGCGVVLQRDSRGGGDETVVFRVSKVPTVVVDLPAVKSTDVDSVLPAPIDRIGEYEILSEIARGAMGVVYRARQIRLNRYVALKMIRSAELADDEEIHRFQREAEAAAQLNHPNIVPVYEVGEKNQRHFFSMGLVEGVSLREFAYQATPDLRHSFTLLRAITDGIAYAHLRNIIHRDLKPSNILIDQDGQPRITDFGLAKRLEEHDGVTVTGQVIGTPSYMAPEQASGRPDQVGIRSDVYSIGAILYFLMTGRPPFHSSNLVETLQQVQLREPIAPRELNPEVDVDAETICLKCLAKEPERRYQSAVELRDELDRYLSGQPIHARPMSSLERSLRWCRRNRAIAGSLFALVLALLTGTIVSTVFAVIADRSETELGKKASELTIQYQKVVEEQARTVAANKETQEQLNRAQTLLARNYFDTAEDAAEAGATTTSLHYLANALVELPAHEKALSRTLRTHLLCSSLEMPQVQLMLPHRGAARFAFSADGTQVATAGVDNHVHIWDTSTGQQLHSFTFAPAAKRRTFAHRSVPESSNMEALSARRMSIQVEQVHFDPTGQFLLLLMQDGTLRVFRPETEEEITLPGLGVGDEYHIDRIHVLANSDQFLLEFESHSSKTRKLRFLDLNTGSVADHGIEFSRDHSISFSPNGRHVAICDGTIKDDEMGSVSIHEIRGGRLAFGPYAVKPWAHITAFRAPYGPDPSKATADQGLVLFGQNETEVISVRDGFVLQTSPPLRFRGSFSHEIQTRPDHKQFISQDGAIMDELTQLQDEIKRPGGQELSVFGRQALWRYSPDQRTLAGLVRSIGTARSGPRNAFSLEFYDSWNNEPVGRPLGLMRMIDSDIHFSPDGRLVAIGSGDADPMVIHVPAAHSVIRKLDCKQVTKVEHHPDAMRILTLNPHRFEMWDIKTGNRLSHEFPHEGSPVWAKFTADGRWLITADSQGTVKLWTLSTGKCTEEWKSQSGKNVLGELSKDRQRIALSDGSDVVVWSLQEQGLTKSRVTVDRPVFKIRWLGNDSLLGVIATTRPPKMQIQMGTRGRSKLREEDDPDLQGHLSIFEATEQVSPRPVFEHVGAVWISSSEDGNRVLTADRFAQFSFWHRIEDGYEQVGETITASRETTKWVRGAASIGFGTDKNPGHVSDSGQCVIIGGLSSLEFRDGGTFEPMAGPIRLGNPPASGLSADGELLAYISRYGAAAGPETTVINRTGAQSGSLSIWNINQNKLLVKRGITESPSAWGPLFPQQLVFAPDRKSLIHTGMGSRIWRYDTARLNSRPIRLDADSVVFFALADSDIGMSIDRHCKVTFIDMPTGVRIGATIHCNYEGVELEEDSRIIRCRSATFVSGDKHAIVLDRSGQIWVVQTPQRLRADPESLQRWVEVITGHSIQSGRGPQQMPAAEWAESRKQFEESDIPVVDENTWRSGEVNRSLGEHDWDRAEFHAGWFARRKANWQELTRKFRLQIARELVMTLYAPTPTVFRTGLGSDRHKRTRVDVCWKALTVARQADAETWRIVTIQSTLAETLFMQAQSIRGKDPLAATTPLCEAESQLLDAIALAEQDSLSWPSDVPYRVEDLKEQLQIVRGALKEIDQQKQAVERKEATR